MAIRMQFRESDRKKLASLAVKKFSRYYDRSSISDAQTTWRTVLQNSLSQRITRLSEPQVPLQGLREPETRIQQTLKECLSAMGTGAKAIAATGDEVLHTEITSLNLTRRQTAEEY